MARAVGGRQKLAFRRQPPPQPVILHAASQHRQPPLFQPLAELVHAPVHGRHLQAGGLGLCSHFPSLRAAEV
jgi:hypothetical protein